MSLSFTKHALLAGTILIGSAFPSMALDADIFAKQLKEQLANNGTNIEYTSAELDGNNVTLKAAKMVAPEVSFPLGDIVFAGVSEKDNGGYAIELTSLPLVSFTKEDVSISVQDISLTNMHIPSGDTFTTVDDMLIYDNFKTGPMMVTVKNAEVFKYSSMDVGIDVSDDKMTMDYDGKIAGIAVDLASINGRGPHQAIIDMGYETLTGDWVLKGDWDMETGRINMPVSNLTLNDVGSLNIALDISGYTLPFLQQLQSMQKEMIGKENDPKAQQAMGLAMMGLMQQLNFNALAIRFDDASFTGKALDYAGKKQGISGEQMAQAAKGLLPFLLTRLGLPELQQQISTAASAFLDDPKNIEVKAAPEQPVAFGQIAGSAMADPRSLAALLNVTVTANQ